MLWPIDLPPGVFRQGTEQQAAGRWWNANLVRWHGRKIGPVGGWQKRLADLDAKSAAAVMAAPIVEKKV